MISDLYKVRDVGQGFVGVMPKPRPDDWLAGEISALKQQGVTVVVSLLEEWEQDDLGLSRESDCCQSNGIEFLSYPIKDRSIPQDFASFRGLISGLYQRLEKDAGIAIHCRAGIGRSGITAISLLVALGTQVDDALSEVSDARGIPVPDTTEQIDWLYDHADQLASISD